MLSYIFKARNMGVLDTLKERLVNSGLPIEVSRMVELEGDACNYRLYDGAKVEFGLTVMSQRLHAKRIRGFAVWQGAGCESLFLGLAETDAGLVFEAACETYGDRTQSMEVFEHRHVTATAVLDVAKEAGLEVDVIDSSGYWKRRDLAKLRQAAEDSRQIIAMLEKHRDSSPLAAILRTMHGGQFDERPV